jgi:hypothetical protein
VSPFGLIQEIELIGSGPSSLAIGDLSSGFG